MLSINLNKTALIITLAMCAHSVEAAALRLLARPTPDRMPEETSQKILELQQEAAGLSPKIITEIDKWHRTDVCTSKCCMSLTRGDIVDTLAKTGIVSPGCCGAACALVSSSPTPFGAGVIMSGCCMLADIVVYDNFGQAPRNSKLYLTPLCNLCGRSITIADFADWQASTGTFQPTYCGAVGSLATGSPLPLTAGILATLFGLCWYEQWKNSTQGPNVQRYNEIQEEIAQLRGAPSLLDCGPF
jgi:hypothetical protein